MPDPILEPFGRRRRQRNWNWGRPQCIISGLCVGIGGDCRFDLWNHGFSSGTTDIEQQFGNIAKPAPVRWSDTDAQEAAPSDYVEAGVVRRSLRLDGNPSVNRENPTPSVGPRCIDLHDCFGFISRSRRQSYGGSVRFAPMGLRFAGGVNHRSEEYRTDGQGKNCKENSAHERKDRNLSGDAQFTVM